MTCDIFEILRWVAKLRYDPLFALKALVSNGFFFKILLKSSKKKALKASKSPSKGVKIFQGNKKASKGVKSFQRSKKILNFSKFNANSIISGQSPKAQKSLSNNH